MVCGNCSCVCCLLLVVPEPVRLLFFTSTGFVALLPLLLCPEHGLGPIDVILQILLILPNNPVYDSGTECLRVSTVMHINAQKIEGLNFL